MQNHDEKDSSVGGQTIGRRLYESFQRGQLDLWDQLIHEDVQLFSPGAWDVRGLDGLKNWGEMFVKALAPRIDLIDEYDGGDKAYITINLNWKHVEPFFHLAPTGREGTSVETFILDIVDGKITRFVVADQTLELSIYLWERGWPMVHAVHPEPLVRGIERR